MHNLGYLARGLSYQIIWVIWLGLFLPKSATPSETRIVDLLEFWFRLGTYIHTYISIHTYLCVCTVYMSLTENPLFTNKFYDGKRLS